LFFDRRLAVGPEHRVTLGVDQLRQAVLAKGFRKQFEVSPGALGLDKQGAHHLARGIVDGPDQTQAWPPTFHPVMGRAVDLKHHPLGWFSFPSTAVLDPTALLGGTNPLGSKDSTHLLP